MWHVLAHRGLPSHIKALLPMYNACSRPTARAGTPHPPPPLAKAEGILQEPAVLGREAGETVTGSPRRAAELAKDGSHKQFWVGLRPPQRALPVVAGVRWLYTSLI